MMYRFMTNNNVTADIIETTTDQVLINGIDYDKARKITKNLNLGGGFDGKTPEFFCSRLKVGAN